MYITTFYSFKGGVGRTIALVNVAVELANRGKRVLIVDFDLEAPGLDTFELLRPATGAESDDDGIPDRGEPVPGIVDFVEAYLETGEAPDVRDFVIKAPDSWRLPQRKADYSVKWPAIMSVEDAKHQAAFLDAKRNVLTGGEEDQPPTWPKRTYQSEPGGRIWLMPAGLQDDRYSARLAAIDWGDLYAHHHGYRLFEDLKLQWQHELKPDYVLIDSRTGLTDVGGICTRQLPDAVVLFTFPNEQNLRGVLKVNAAIAKEKEGPARKDIKRHYVLSNVPDLDDESGILGAISDRLLLNVWTCPEEGPHPLVLIVHHYPSLALLSQVVFVRDRPDTRLAAEYRVLARRIVEGNPADREGVLSWLANRPNLFDADIEGIASRHEADGELLFYLAKAVGPHVPIKVFGIRQAGLISRAIDAGCRKPEAYIIRAENRIREGDLVGAREDALHALHDESIARRSSLRERALLVLQAEEGHVLFASPAIRNLDPLRLVRLVENSTWSTVDAAAAVASLGSLLEESPNLPDRVEEQVRIAMAEALLAEGSIASALDQVAWFLGRRVKQAVSRRIFIITAVGEWTATEKPVPKFFKLALEAASDEDPWPSEPSNRQAAALCYWALGDASTANRMIELASEAARTQRHGRLFNYWRFLNAAPEAFQRDLEDMKRFIGGDSSVKPPLMTLAAGAASGAVN